MRVLVLIVASLWFNTITLAQINTESFIDDSLLIPSQLAVVDGWLFVKSEMTSKGIRAYNIKSGTLEYEFAQNGRGPAEYLNFSILRGPNTAVLEISDTSNKKNDLIDVKCLKKKPPIELVNRCIISSIPNRASRHAVVIKDDKVLNHGSDPEGVVYLSRGGDIYEYLVKTPSMITDKYVRGIHQAFSQTGTITATSDRTHFAYFADSYDKAIFFVYENDKIQKINELQASFLPEFEVIDYGGSSVMEQSETYRAAFTWSTTGRSYFYALYSGKKLTEVPPGAEANRVAFTGRVQQYDLNGVLRNEFEIDRELFSIAADESDSKIYGIEYDEEGNFHIVRFAIPDINTD